MTDTITETPQVECYLYHIRRLCDAGDTTEGYIGISNNPARRFREHIAGGANGHLDSALTKYADAEMVIIAEGSREEMLEEERSLRPERNMGWNIARGGLAPPEDTGKTTCEVDLDKFTYLLGIGVPKAKLAVHFGICRSTVYKIIREASNEHPK